jgi:sugar phosphate isomerase/epimerase
MKERWPVKYAFMSFSCPQLALGDMLLVAKRFGYDGIEPRIQAEHNHGIELEASSLSRREVMRRVQDAGVTLCCIATSCRYADPKETDTNIDTTRRAIDLAADVDCPAIRVFGGTIPDDVSREQATGLVAAALRDVAEHAADRGITVALETHDSWCDPAHIAEVMRRVDHPAIGVNWDIMHPVRQGGYTIDQAFDTLEPWIQHVHFHDGSIPLRSLELCPIGEGGIDHRAAVLLLQRAGYTGYLSGEWINWTSYEEHLPRELATMKRYELETG